MSSMNINNGEMNQLLYGRTGPVVREVTRVARDVQALAKTLAPIDKGPLRSSITAVVQANPGAQEVTARIGSRLPYAIYQETGTGIYGPRGAPIRPTTRRYLRFKPKGSDRFVFAKQVRGAPAIHYLTRALATACPWPITRSNPY